MTTATEMTQEDLSIIGLITTDKALAYRKSDRHDAGLMHRSQQCGSAYMHANRDGYTVLIRVRQLDLG